MERKIGEIFEYNGEWYQCINTGNCSECAFTGKRCYDFSTKGVDIIGDCTGRTFKKLEKVGGPITVNGKNVQLLKTTIANCENCAFYKDVNCDFTCYPRKCYGGEEGTYVEIKQTKEDMEEKKLIEFLSEKVHNAWMKEKEEQGFSYGKDYDKEKKKHPDMLPYNELKEEVKEYDRATVRAVLQAQKELQSEYNYNNLKPFDLEAAKAGKPVCTRDGRKARIICFDAKDTQPIIGLYEKDIDGIVREYLCSYHMDGRMYDDHDCGYDLMMLPEKKEGWVNVYREESNNNERLIEQTIYKTRKDAFEKACPQGYITTTKINWEE